MTTTPCPTPAALCSRRHPTARLFTALVAAGLASTSGHAATFTKANNTTSYHLAGSYTASSGVPGATDTIQFDGTLTGNNTASIGNNLSIFGISQLTTVGGTQTINPTPGRMLTIGAGGIDQQSTTFALFLSANTTLSADQAWKIAKQISVGGGGFSLNSNALTTTGAGLLSISGPADGSPLVVDLSTAALGNTSVSIGNNASTTVTFGTANTFDDLKVTNGRVSGSTLGNFGVASSFGDGGTSTTITLGNSTNGVLEYTGATTSSNRTFTRDGRSAASGIEVTNAGSTLTVSGNLSTSTSTLSVNAGSNGWVFGGAGNLVLSGVINQGGAALSTDTTVTKNGTGTLTLSGANTYRGTTTITAGTLVSGSATAFSSATGQVNVSGGTLDSSVAATTFGGAINLSSGAVNINTNSAVGTFTLASGKNFTASGGTLTFNLGTAFDQIISAGGSAKFDLTGSTLALDITGAGFDYGTSYQLFKDFNALTSVAGTANITGYDTVGFTAALSNNGVLAFTAIPSAIPEPSTYASLAGLGVLILAANRRRKQS